MAYNISVLAYNTSVRPERSEAKSKDALSHREREFKPEWTDVP